MPCNLISSCFFPESPWFREIDCAGPGQPQHQDWQHTNQPGGAVADQPNMGSTGPANSSEPGGAYEEHKKVSKTFRQYLPSCHRTYSCVHCRAHLANHDELISKSFQGSQGRAYLFNSVVNVGCGPAEERVLLTGLHAVADIFCDCCKTTLGWKYEHAFESSQKYKEGKFIIELAHMIKENGWEKESWSGRFGFSPRGRVDDNFLKQQSTPQLHYWCSPFLTLKCNPNQFFTLCLKHSDVKNLFHRNGLTKD